jgi:hypothetical protein
MFAESQHLRATGSGRTQGPGGRLDPAPGHKFGRLAAPAWSRRDHEAAREWGSSEGEVEVLGDTGERLVEFGKVAVGRPLAFAAPNDVLEPSERNSESESGARAAVHEDRLPRDPVAINF